MFKLLGGESYLTNLSCGGWSLRKVSYPGFQTYKEPSVA